MYETKFIYKPVLIVIDIIGYVFFWWLKLKPFRMPKKILCIRIENIGDVILTTPSFRALKNKFPNAKLDVLVRSQSKEVLEGNKNVDKVFFFNFHWLGTESKKESWRKTFKFIKKLKKEKYDLVIDFHSDPRNIILAFLVGGYKIGYAIRGFSFLLNKFVPFNKKQHQIQINLDLIRSIGADSDEKLDFFISKKDIEFSKKILNCLNKNSIILSPSASRKSKLWSDKHWSDLADKLIEQYNYKIVLTGTRTDYSKIEQIIKKIKNKKNVKNLSGNTSIKQLGSLIYQSKLLISLDSGPVHIARALKTPTIVLFSEEKPERWGYKNNNCDFIKKEKINKITVNEVLKVVEELNVL